MTNKISLNEFKIRSYMVAQKQSIVRKSGFASRLNPMGGKMSMNTSFAVIAKESMAALATQFVSDRTSNIDSSMHETQRRQMIPAMIFVCKERIQELVCDFLCC